MDDRPRSMVSGLSSIVFLNRKHNLRAFSFFTLNFQLTARELGAFTHADETEMSRGFFGHCVEADAVILNGEREVDIAFEMHAEIFGARVVDNIFNGLLRYADDGLLYVWAEGGHGIFKIKRQIKVEARRSGFSHTLNGEAESHIFQGG